MKDSLLVTLLIFACVWWADYRAELEDKRDYPDGCRHYNVKGAENCS
jgi:hypothetical protein